MAPNTEPYGSVSNTQTCGKQDSLLVVGETLRVRHSLAVLGDPERLRRRMHLNLAAGVWPMAKFPGLENCARRLLSSK